MSNKTREHHGNADKPEAPLLCAICGGIGHTTEDCRTKKITLAAAQCITEAAARVVSQRPGAPNMFHENPHTALAQKRKERCVNCGDLTHSRETCPEPARCDKCGSSGHASQKCTVKMCYRCGRKGHTLDTCVLHPNVKCIKCSSIGHIDRACPSVACRWCGEKGHRPMQCKQNPNNTFRQYRQLEQTERDKFAFQIEKQRALLSSVESNGGAVTASILDKGPSLAPRGVRVQKDGEKQPETNKEQQQQPGGGLGSGRGRRLSGFETSGFHMRVRRKREDSPSASPSPDREGEDEGETGGEFGDLGVGADGGVTVRKKIRKTSVDEEAGEASVEKVGNGKEGPVGEGGLGGLLDYASDEEE
uniref:CCHC-type domain-containing protein n=1 Tax=Chromera velia CCMP2878 TaxID=1169474 RepID=A0A0G4HL53_9ALVE|eukprot:Cvel_28631.t1-p1 / transcript=Cvel_28631.t1 / gene=Cvel_28631 / organism=Chromera_velia_CCMP2878 / gene_product=CCHC-type zinc finger protein CG3800, putative / transcript_product=CCHC-type zinc finger protein CG3800, putative / location=Cvel_scaffold3783:416-4797(+) / protein_length=360 / sequence_SO=supercontig / SO=protein_coding / is_pseudo=false